MKFIYMIAALILVTQANYEPECITETNCAQCSYTETYWIDDPTCTGTIYGGVKPVFDKAYAAVNMNICMIDKTSVGEYNNITKCSGGILGWDNYGDDHFCTTASPGSYEYEHGKCYFMFYDDHG